MNDRLYRSVDDRVFGGVCAGLADRMDMDPALVRIGYAILALVTGIFPLLILYIIMVVVIPEEPNWAGVRPVSPQPGGPTWAAGGTQPGGPTWAAGGPPAGAATTSSAEPSSDPAASTGAPAAPAMSGAPGAVPGWIPPGVPPVWDGGSWRDQRSMDRAARRAERSARHAEHRSDPVPAIIGGLFLVALGAFFLLRNTFDIDWAVVWPVAVIAFGVVILIAAFRPRSG